MGPGQAVGTQRIAGSDGAVVRARGLTKTYEMGEVAVHALRTVDLDLYGGEFVVMLGPSGSGKTTLLNILGGLDLPSSGTVLFLDHHLAAADERELTRFRREHVGFVFQSYNLIPSLTARARRLHEGLGAGGGGAARARRRGPGRLPGGARRRLSGGGAHRPVGGRQRAHRARDRAVPRGRRLGAVFIVDRGRARERPVAIGHRNAFEAEITSGVAVGDIVVRHPGDRVRDGVRVAPR